MARPMLSRAVSRQLNARRSTPAERSPYHRRARPRWRAHGAPPRRPSRGCRDLVQASGPDVVHEAPNVVAVRDERARLDPGERLAHILVDARERLEREGGTDPGVGLDLRLHVVVAEGEHAA